MKRKAVALSFLFFCIMCGSVPISVDSPRPSSRRWSTNEIPVVWAFDCTFPEQFKDDIEKSFEFWEKKTPINLFYKIDKCVDSEKTYPASGVISVTFDPGASGRNDDECGFTELAVAHTFTGWNKQTVDSVKLIFWGSWSEDDLKSRRKIAVHEIGHALGLYHFPYDTCIMYRFAAAKSSDEPCEQELNEFDRLYGREAFPK